MWPGVPGEEPARKPAAGKIARPTSVQSGSALPDENFDKLIPRRSMSEQNRAIVRRWFEEVWNQGREATIDELFPGNGVAHGLGDSEADVHGPAEFKVFVANLRGSIPDTHIRVDDIVSEGDRVALRISYEGTHTGHGLGVPPSGRRISIKGIIIVRIIDGQIVEGWNSYDQLGLLRQIGALPSAGDRDRFLTATP
jgi:steroid delta-isomerase-like uncharacterized protein